MHNKHTPQRPDGFAKYRARHYRGARHTLLLLPPAKRRALRRNLVFIGLTLAVLLLIALLSKAHAAGGAYVVDDGAINAPGTCNVDAWFSANRHDGSSHNETLSPACNFSALPSVQWGAALSRTAGETQISPQLKAQVVSREELGLEMAVAAGAHFALDRRHAFDGADLNVPLTWQPLQALRLNLNAGWTHAYDDGEQNHRLTWQRFRVPTGARPHADRRALRPARRRPGLANRAAPAPGRVFRCGPDRRAQPER